MEVPQSSNSHGQIKYTFFSEKQIISACFVPLRMVQFLSAEWTFLAEKIQQDLPDLPRIYRFFLHSTVCRSTTKYLLCAIIYLLFVITVAVTRMRKKVVMKQGCFKRSFAINTGLLHFAFSLRLSFLLSCSLSVPKSLILLKPLLFVHGSGIIGIVVSTFAVAKQLSFLGADNWILAFVQYGRIGRHFVKRLSESKQLEKICRFNCSTKVWIAEKRKVMLSWTIEFFYFLIVINSLLAFALNIQLDTNI